MAEKTPAERAASLTLRLRDSLRILEAHADGGKRMMVLAGLHEYEERNGSPVTVSEIAARSGLKLPNVSRLLRPFEDDGLVAREKRGRSVYVTVTERGKRMLEERYGRFLDELQETVFAPLDEGERQIFLSCMEKIAAGLEEKAKKINSGEGNA